MRKITKEIGEKILNLYNTGEHSGADIGRFFSISSTNVNKFLRKSGIESRTMSSLKRKYPLNEHFFDEINTEEKAYILGLLYADGYNNVERGAVSLRLREDDKEVLEKIKNLIQPTKQLNYEIKKTDCKGCYKNTKNQYKLSISSRYISQRLLELGCGQAKTHTLIFPNEEQVPKHLQKHFIRGYFDGDGSVSVSGQKMFSIIGSQEFIYELQTVIMDCVELSRTKLYDRFPERNTNIRSLNYCGKPQTIRFGKWLYEDATIYIERKKLKFDSIK